MLHSQLNASLDRSRSTTSRNANESESDNSPANVRSPRRGHERLDRRHILDTMASHDQDQERRARLARSRRSSRRYLDRELELGTRRQQDAYVGQRRSYTNGMFSNTLS